MNKRRVAAKGLLWSSLLSLGWGLAAADTPVDDTHLVAATGSPAPSEYVFTTTTAEALTLTLTDFQQPAAFGSLQVAVTLNDTLVGKASVDATHTAIISIPAAIGTYAVHIVGAPDSQAGFGSFGACVTRDSDPTPRSCIPADSFAGNIDAESTQTSGSQLSTSFTTTTAGNYTITLSDDAFPTALTQLTGLIIKDSTSYIITPGAPMQVNLAAGTSYQLLVAAFTNNSTPAGLYGVKLIDPSGATLFDRSIPVGQLTSPATSANPTAQALTLSLTDFDYPAALSNIAVAVTAGSTLLADLTAPGTAPIAAAPQGSLDVWTYAVAATQPGVYSASLASASASVYSTTQVVNPTGSGSTPTFAYVTSLPAAGSYTLTTSDFQFPAALTSLSATIAQNGTVLTEDANGNFTGAAGNAVIVVQAQPPASGTGGGASNSGSGIFSLTLQTAGASPSVILSQTQAVGGVFTQRTVTFSGAGDYDLTLTDLAFPKGFSNLSVLLSQGTQVLGKIYGGGTVSFKSAQGQYVLSYVATPGDQSGGYGLYATNISSSPPTVTFTADKTSVPSGQTVNLTWSSTDATSCTASGGTGWSGAQAASGTLAIQVSATETLSLACTGAGGTTTQTLTITTTAAQSSHSGGGRLDAWLLALLAMLVLMKANAPRRARR